jgi:hypothetical protein
MPYTVEVVQRRRLEALFQRHRPCIDCGKIMADELKNASRCQKCALVKIGLKESSRESANPMDKRMAPYGRDDTKVRDNLRRAYAGDPEFNFALRKSIEKAMRVTPELWYRDSSEALRAMDALSSRAKQIQCAKALHVHSNTLMDHLSKGDVCQGLVSYADMHFPARKVPTCSAGIPGTGR